MSASVEMCKYIDELCKFQDFLLTSGAEGCIVTLKIPLIPRRQDCVPHPKGDIMYTIQELYDLNHTAAAGYLSQFTYPWEALKGIKDMILELGSQIGRASCRERV